MAGNRAFWRETAESLTAQGQFGRMKALDDSRPVLELATGGEPGLVLHGGTGSFVAARAPDKTFYYAGGLGWRFSDPGSGYEIGRRAISRALLEMQGWALPSRLDSIVRDATGLGEAGAITRFFYDDPAPNAKIAALAPAVLRLATEGDHTAHQLVMDACQPLLDLALQVAEKLFPGTPPGRLRAGLSGPILTHPTVATALVPRSPLALFPLTDPPIEGVRRLLVRPGAETRSGL
jgi:N-acetylglucosamine kinase-like BadF-type ATPase